MPQELHKNCCAPNQIIQRSETSTQFFFERIQLETVPAVKLFLNLKYPFGDRRTKSAPLSPPPLGRKPLFLSEQIATVIFTFANETCRNIARKTATWSHLNMLEKNYLQFRVFRVASLYLQNRQIVPRWCSCVLKRLNKIIKENKLG